MSAEFFILVTFAILLNLKHFICEYLIQDEHLFHHKLRYGSINSLRHTLHQAFGTLVAGLIVNFDLILVVGLVLVEAIIHYHSEWAIARFGAKSYKDKKYWQWFGAQEFINHVTFILLIILARLYLTIND